MATRRVPMLNWSTLATGDGAYVTAFESLATNDRWRHLVLSFPDIGSGPGTIWGIFDVPQNYVDTARFVVVWSTSATSGNVFWECDYRAVGGNDAESLDQTGEQATVNATDGAPSAAWERQEISITLTDSHFAAGDSVQFEFYRNSSNISDTLAATAALVGLFFEYDDGT